MKRGNTVVALCENCFKIASICAINFEDDVIWFQGNADENWRNGSKTSILQSAKERCAYRGRVPPALSLTFVTRQPDACSTRVSPKRVLEADIITNVVFRGRIVTKIVL